MLKNSKNADVEALQMMSYEVTKLRLKKISNKNPKKLLLT